MKIKPYGNLRRMGKYVLRSDPMEGNLVRPGTAGRTELPILNTAVSESNLKGRTLLAIFAHPDDELFISPLLANYARRGVDCHLAIATDGRFGVQPHTGGIAGDALAALRSKELRAAAAVLGIRVPIQLGFRDGFSHKTEDLGDCLDDVSSLSRKVLALFEEITPDAVITFGSDGFYGHPDHLLVGNAVSSAYQSKERSFPPLSRSWLSTKLR